MLNLLIHVPQNGITITGQGGNLLMSGFILLNILWIISWIITGIAFWITPKSERKYFDRAEIQRLLDFILLFLWGCVAFLFLSLLISNWL